MASWKEGGFLSLYDDIAGDLKGLAISRLGSPEDAEDIVQEAFLRLHREHEKAAIENPRGFVFRVGWNLIIDTLRRRKRQPAFAVDSREGDTVSDERTPEQHALGREELRAMAAAIRALPPQARRVFILRRIADKPYAEIADILKISESTVKNHMVRALMGLAEQRLKFREPVE